MIRTEDLTINGKAYTRTWSDTGHYIERDGQRYEEAIDPAELGRMYVETEIAIETELDASEALEELVDALRDTE